MSAVIVLILSVLTFLFALWLGEDSDKKFEKKETTGVIEKAIYEASSSWFYVSFFVDGEKITAQSNSYTQKNGSLYKGDAVLIKYYFTKGGKPRVDIIDDRLEPVSIIAKSASRVFVAVSLLLLAVSVCLLIN